MADRFVLSVTPLCRRAVNHLFILSLLTFLLSGTSSGQTKYLQRGQNLLGFGVSYSKVGAINTRGLEFASSSDGVFAVGGFFALTKPEGARIVGVGFDGNLKNPGAKPGFGFSVGGSFARASITDRSSSTAVALSLEPFLRYPGESFDFIPYAQVSGAYSREFAFGASFGADVLVKPSSGGGVSLGAAVTMVDGETGFAFSVAVLLVGSAEQ